MVEPLSMSSHGLSSARNLAGAGERLIDEYMAKISRGRLAIAVKFSFNTSVLELLEATLGVLENKLAIIEAVYVDGTRVMFLVADQVIMDARYYASSGEVIQDTDKVLELISRRGVPGKFYATLLEPQRTEEISMVSPSVVKPQHLLEAITI
ncbi:MAG: hypothetical protein ABWW69_03125 [Pyrodictiaceae archaeon]